MTVAEEGTRPALARPPRWINKPWHHWAILAALTLFVITLTILGIRVRHAQFDRTTAIRFSDDVAHGYAWGQFTCDHGLFNAYDDYANTNRILILTQGLNDLDYAPLRLTMMNRWAAWARLYYPKVRSWQNDYYLSQPVLYANFLAEWLSAMLVFLLVRHWTIRAHGLTAPRRPFLGVTRGLIGAALLWFNPAVIWDGAVFPQWDIWLAPFFLAAILLAGWEWWLAAGCCIAVGAFLKGQILLVAPIFLLWPMCQLRMGAAIRFVAGFTAVSAAIAFFWMQPSHAGIHWLMLAGLALAITIPIIRRSSLNIYWIAGLAAAAVLLAFPAFADARWPWKILPPLAVGALSLTRFLPPASKHRRHLVPALYAGAIGLFALLLMPLFHARTSWFTQGFEFGTRKFMVMATQDTYSIPYMLQTYFRWRGGPETHLTWPFLTFFSMRWFMLTIYALCLLACSIAAAIHHRRNDPRFLAAFVAPWLCWFVLLTQLNNRYLVWAAAFSALFTAVGVGMTLLGLIVSTIAWLGIAAILTWGGADPTLTTWVRPLTPHVAWALIICAGVYLWVAITPAKRSPLP